MQLLTQNKRLCQKIRYMGFYSGKFILSNVITQSSKDPLQTNLALIDFTLEFVVEQIARYGSW